MNNIPLTLSEGCTLLSWDKNKGMQAASSIANRTATYDSFRELGCSAGQCLALLVLNLTARDSTSLLQEQFSRVQSALNVNDTAMTNFVTWAKDHLSFDVTNMLSAADTLTEKQAIIEWMRTNNYLNI